MLMFVAMRVVPAGLAGATVLLGEVVDRGEHFHVGHAVRVHVRCPALPGGPSAVCEFFDERGGLGPFDAESAVGRDEPVLGDEPAHHHQELVQRRLDAVGVFAGDVPAELADDRLALHLLV